MSMMGYKPPFSKGSPNPYADGPPVNPFINAPESIAPQPNRPVGNYDKEHMIFNPDIGGSLLKAPTIKPHFFEKGGVGSRIINALGEVSLSYNAQQGDPMSLSILRQRETTANRTADDAQWKSRWQMQREAEQTDREAQRNAPQYFSGNEDRVRLDPMTGQSSVVYDAPTDAQEYASSQNFQPGTPDYGNAIRDFTLRGNGPTAFGFRTDLEGTRAGFKNQLQDRRFGQQTALRTMPTYRDTHAPPRRSATAGGGLPHSPGAAIAPIIAKMSRGETLSPGEHQALDYYKRGNGRGRGDTGGSGGPTEGQSATGPGGHKIVVRGGRWVDQATGRPVG